MRRARRRDDETERRRDIGARPGEGHARADEEADEETARRKEAPSLFGGAVPRRFRVDPDAAPPDPARHASAETRSVCSRLSRGTRATKEKTSRTTPRGKAARRRPLERRRKPGSLSAMLARARCRRPGPWPTRFPPRALLPRPRVTIRRRFETRRSRSTRRACSCARARHELGAAPHEALVRAPRLQGERRRRRRFARRDARAEDDPSANGLYATFGVLVPETHKRAHATHLDALRARKKARKKNWASRATNENAVKNGAGPATTLGALDRDPSRVSRKRAGALRRRRFRGTHPRRRSRGTRERRFARRSNLRPPSRWRARLPGACCAATRAASPSRRSAGTRRATRAGSRTSRAGPEPAQGARVAVRVPQLPPAGHQEAAHEGVLHVGTSRRGRRAYE